MPANRSRFPLGPVIVGCLLTLLMTMSLSLPAFAASGHQDRSAQPATRALHQSLQATTTDRVRVVYGKSRGSTSLHSLSAAERSRRETLTKQMEPPLPPIPGGTTNVPHPRRVAPTSSSILTLKQAPGAAVSSSLHDLGVHTTDFINEPSVASDGTNVLETWNWNSGISTDGGSTWTYYDPVTLFPKANGGWCCDSHTIYASSQNIFIWNLQYVQDANGNTYRLAVANGGSDLSSATFHYWDLTPQQTNGGTGDWYDFPNLSISNNYAYLQANVFHASGQFAYETVVMRFALSDLTKTSGSLNYGFLIANGVTTVAFANGATSTIYFASHLSTSKLRVFSWDESSTNYSWNDVDHVSYPAGTRDDFNCTRTGGSNWCARSDARLLSGWVSNGIIGFSWNAPQGKWGFDGSAPYPYTDIVRINEATKIHIDDPIVWNSSYAFMYMSHYPNANGDLGGTFMVGGGARYEDGGVYIWDGQGRDFPTIVQGNQDETAGGDFLSTRSLGGNWVGTVYSPQSDGVHPYNVVFGR